MESGDVDWTSSNLGFDFTFGPVTFQEDLNGNRQISACIIEEIMNNDKLHVSRYYIPVGNSLKDQPTEAEDVEIELFFSFTILSGGAFTCEGIHIDNTNLDRTLIALVKEETGPSVNHFAMVELMYDRSVPKYYGNLHLMEHNVVSVFKIFGRSHSSIAFKGNSIYDAIFVGYVTNSGNYGTILKPFKPDGSCLKGAYQDIPSGGLMPISSLNTFTSGFLQDEPLAFSV